MKTIKIDEMQHDFPAICRAVASTGQAVVVTCGHEPLVSIVPLPRPDASRQESVWELRRQFEARHGVLTEEFDLPPREIDAERWENPLKD